MSGESRVNKAHELFYTVSLNKDFRQIIVELRAQFGIPKEGFLQKLDSDKWLKNMDVDNKATFPFYFAQGQILRAFSLPSTSEMMNA